MGFDADLTMKNGDIMGHTKVSSIFQEQDHF